MDGLMVGLERQISRTPPPKFKLPFSTWHIADWLLRGAGITDLSELHPTMVKDIVEQISQSRELGRLESDSLPQPDELLDTIFSLSERRVTSILSLGRR